MVDWTRPERAHACESEASPPVKCRRFAQRGRRRERFGSAAHLKALRIVVTEESKNSTSRSLHYPRTAEQSRVVSAWGSEQVSGPHLEVTRGGDVPGVAKEGTLNTPPERGGKSADEAIRL